MAFNPEGWCMSGSEWLVLSFNVHVEGFCTLKNDTRWKQHHNTFTPSLHLVPFRQVRTPNMYTNNHLLLFTNHLPVYKMSACSAAIQFHSITYTLTYHTDSALLVHSTASAYKTDCIYHAQQQLCCSNPQHNLLSMHVNMRYTLMSTTQASAFHHPPMRTNQHKAKWNKM